MTVNELRRLLIGLPADMPVAIEIWRADGELVQADLDKGDPEERCDEIERLYLFGHEPGVDDDDDEEPRPKLELVR